MGLLSAVGRWHTDVEPVWIKNFAVRVIDSGLWIAFWVKGFSDHVLVMSVTGFRLKLSLAIPGSEVGGKHLVKYISLRILYCMAALTDPNLELIFVSQCSGKVLGSPLQFGCLFGRDMNRHANW